MPNGLKYNVKLFADDTSLFSVVKNKGESASDLTNGLGTISKWAYNCKKKKTPKKPRKTYYYLGKSHPSISFNNVQVQRANQQKHSLHQKCPNTEFFLVRIFPYSD